MIKPHIKMMLMQIQDIVVEKLTFLLIEAFLIAPNYIAYYIKSEYTFLLQFSIKKKPSRSIILADG